MNAQSISIVSLAFSLINLFLVAYLAWVNYLSPMNVRLSTSVLTLRPLIENESMQLHAVLTILLCNEGARGGFVEDIALRFRSEDGVTNWLYQPFYFIDYGEFLRIQLSHKRDVEAIKTQFHPIWVPGKQTVTETIIFGPEVGNPDFPLGKLSPAKFYIDIITRDSASFDWKIQKTISYNLKGRTLESLVKGTTTFDLTDLGEPRKKIKPDRILK